MPRDFYDEIRQIAQDWVDSGATRDDIEWQVEEILENLEGE